MVIKNNFFKTKLYRMKTWIYILSSLLAIILLGSLGVQKEEMTDEMITALKNGDANSLSIYFNQSIDLKIIDKSGVFNKKQAEIILENFFNENKISSLDVKQYKEQTNFTTIICNMKTQNNNEFIIYLNVTNFNQTQLITQIKISSSSN